MNLWIGKECKALRHLGDDRVGCGVGWGETREPLPPGTFFPSVGDGKVALNAELNEAARCASVSPLLCDTRRVSTQTRRGQLLHYHEKETKGTGARTMFSRRSPPATPEAKSRMDSLASSSSCSSVMQRAQDRKAQQAAAAGACPQDEEDPTAWRRRRAVIPGSTALHQVQPPPPFFFSIDFISSLPPSTPFYERTCRSPLRSHARAKAPKEKWGT
jgi:hypothetical protein